MEENLQPSTRSIGFKYGLILGLISIVLFIVFDFAGLSTNSWARWVGIIPTIALIFMAHKAFKDDGDGFMSYGQGVGIGAWLSMLSALVSSVFTMLYIMFINPSYMDAAKQEQIQQLEEQGMTDAQIEQAMSFAEMFMSPGAILIFGLIGGTIIGVIISLIIAAITKEDNPQAFS